MPLFSILHTSARPHKWREIYEDWMSKAVFPEDVEYVLCADDRWGFKRWDESPLDLVRNGLNKLVWNEGRRCYVEGVNTAAKASSGRILIVNADDQYACEGWDEKLCFALDRTEHKYFPSRRPDADFVIEVSTGTPQEHERGIMVMPILSRARYERLGYVFFPAYESMYADNEFCEHARKDGVVIDARHLLFPHKHPINGQAPNDEAYAAQNRKEAYQFGELLYRTRRAQGFPPYVGPFPEMKVPMVETQTATRENTVRVNAPTRNRSVVVALSGGQFQGSWVDGILTLYAHLIDRGFDVIRLREDTPNVYVTRESLAEFIRSVDPKPELVLWLDDDNICSPEHFDRLLSQLDARPDLHGVTGWCWIHDAEKKVFRPSCGMWSPDHAHWTPFPVAFANEAALRPIEVSGFPCLLMRREALDITGKGAFLPVLDSQLPWGVMGEDLAFFRSAETAGLKFAADPQVRVPHLKYVEVNPVLPEEGAAQVKIACMMRVRNEGRWISRVIESVKPLCGENIYVFDDESTDGTPGKAFLAGATVFHDPFAGQPLDERRDKNWLMAEVRRLCSPDWILCIDGDEELEPGGAEKIRQILAGQTRVDCFGLRVLDLWNSPDTIRIDGRYGVCSRQSLFRVMGGLEFKSYYEGEPGAQCHTGLHCSNSPFDLRTGLAQVYLLHYGYMLKEDRIRKWNWYNSIDPHNEIEDEYRHVVQGDVPEVPADAKLKYAGPLELRKMPPHMIPKFEAMPEPIRQSRDRPVLEVALL